MSLITTLVLAVAGLACVPVAVLLVEVTAACLPGPRATTPLPRRRGRVAILVPAHNESGGLLPTLQGAQGQVAAGDRIIVVADNCDDDTAEVARRCGVEVVERTDPVRRGKSFALDHGVQALRPDPPDQVVILDADCLLAPGALDRLTDTCEASGRSTQALYLMEAPASLGLQGRIASFAWRVKNHVRPLGLWRLGAPCQLMGTGMAFPWPVISGATLATGHIAEDLLLGLDIAANGQAAQFCPDAVVTSRFAGNAEGARSQRTRWEHGHLHLILTRVPGLLWQALRARSGGLFALTLDLLVPPVALLALVLLGLTLFAALLFAAGLPTGTALGLSIMLVAAFAGATGLAWLRFARDTVSLRDLATTPVYILRKLPLYLRFLTARQVNWIRSRRDED
jgi:cellulose synthase/poly-beta-1,6-N-acetylglucosamine synthase-like glycosyltransferase